MVFDTGHRPLVAVLVLKVICWLAVDEIVSGLVISCDMAGAAPTRLVLTELSSAIVVSPVVIPELLPVFTIGVPLGEVGVVGGVVVGGVGLVGGELQDTEVAVVLHPFCKLLKLSSELLTQPLNASDTTTKAIP
jgi:hypothetical protein